MIAKSISEFNRALRLHCSAVGLRVEGPKPGEEHWDNGILTLNLTVFARDGHIISRVAGVVLRAHRDVFDASLVAYVAASLVDQASEKRGAGAGVEILEHIQNLQSWLKRWAS